MKANLKVAERFDKLELLKTNKKVLSDFVPVRHGKRSGDRICKECALRLLDKRLHFLSNCMIFELKTGTLGAGCAGKMP